MEKGLKENLYDLLVNRDFRIAARYQAYARSHSGSGRFGAWFYLLGLNLRYGLSRGKKLPLGPSESQTARLPRPEAVAGELAAYDVVCFDVFDTLIFRPFARPTHLFWQLEGAFAYPNLARLRIRGEELARREKRKTAGTAEVTLPEIWQQMELLTGIPAREGERREWELEKKYCFPNPYIRSLTRELEKLGVTTVLISDMYVSAAQIQELLTACGYGEFSRCFVSCEHGCSKSDGGLYRVVKKTLGEGLRYAQVGDNPHSDGRQAKEHGFTPFPYPNVNAAGRPWRWEHMSPLTGSVYQGLINAWLHNGLAVYSHAYELGFACGGILCLGYCRWIHQYVTAHGIEKILFLTPEDDILPTAYGLLYPGEADRCCCVSRILPDGSSAVAVTWDGGIGPVTTLAAAARGKPERVETYGTDSRGLGMLLEAARQSPEVRQGIFDYVNFHQERMGDFPLISGDDAFAPLHMLGKNLRWLKAVK